MNKPRCIKRLLSLAALISVIAVICGTLTGCGLFGILSNDSQYADFTKSSITLELGESYDLSKIISGNTDKYTLEVTPKSVAELKGKTLKAVGEGMARVTCTTDDNISTLSVRVTKKEEDGLTLSYEGELIQTVGASTAVVITPHPTGSVSDGRLDWYINGVKSVSLAANVAFSYTPTAAGTYVISARSGSISDEITVRAYRAVEATGAISGSLEQSEPFTPLILTANVKSIASNPDDYIEWFVDGECVHFGSEKSYTYMPSAGTHTITLRVNGVDRTINGKVYATLIFKGSITPVDPPAVLFDNMWPHLYITYNVAGYACVEITSPSGAVSEYRQTDSRYASLFSSDRFDAAQFMQLCGTGTLVRTYKIRVKSLGDGHTLTESAYSKQTSFTQLPSDAKKYLEDKYFDRDHYITSDEEYVNLFGYYNIYRNKNTSPTPVSFACYMGYTSEFSVKDLWDTAFHTAATSGHYTGIDYTKSGNVLYTKFTVDVINRPTRQTSDKPGSSYDKQLHAILPHINYDESKYRDMSYVFPIDMLETTQSVTYTDELYLAAENSIRPVPETGSAAATVYELARGVLRKIVTDDMTDMQKAHAIYDWIMWTVSYDIPASSTTLTQGESYSAFYLEGVFGDGNTSIDGVKYKPYAVCDGMSKAYSLLCNIEGIPCVRVGGFAGKSIKNAGGHAWNKVCLDGSWYIVDCTWGDSASTLTINGRRGSYEVGAHNWLFVTDGQADVTHFEPYEYGTASFRYAPRTTTQKYNVYKDMVYNGVEIDCSIAAGEDDRTRLAEISRAFAGAYTPKSAVNIPGGTGGGIYPVDYQGIDIMCEGGITLSDIQIKSVVETTVRSVRLMSDVKVFTYDNCIVILIR